MLKVNSRSSANGGSGSTIIASMSMMNSGAISARMLSRSGRAGLASVGQRFHRAVVASGGVASAGRCAARARPGRRSPATCPALLAALVGAQLVDVGQHLATAENSAAGISWSISVCLYSARASTGACTSVTLFSLAMSRIFSDISRCPSRRPSARPLPSAYLSATAKWVGLITTRSAFGTSPSCVAWPSRACARGPCP